MNSKNPYQEFYEKANQLFENSDFNNQLDILKSAIEMFNELPLPNTNDSKLLITKSGIPELMTKLLKKVKVLISNDKLTNNELNNILTSLWEIKKINEINADAKTWGSFSYCAGRCLNGDLLEEIWKNWKKNKILLGSKDWAGFINSATHTSRPYLLNDFWIEFKKQGGPQGSYAWSTFANAVAKYPDGGVSLLKEIWDEWKHISQNDSSKTWIPFIISSCQLSKELFREICEVFDAYKMTFNQGDYIKLLDEAKNKGLSDIIEKKWMKEDKTNSLTKERCISLLINRSSNKFTNALLDVQIKFLSKYLNNFDITKMRPQECVKWATNAKNNGFPFIVKSIWQESIEHGIQYNDVKQWVSFFQLATEINDGDFVKDLWDIWKESGKKMSSYGWNIIAKSTSVTGDEEFMMEVWDSWVATKKSNKRNLTSFLNASGRIGSEQMVETIWEFTKKRNFQLNDYEISMFVLSAGHVNRQDIFEEIWNIWKENGFSTDARTWSTIATVSGWLKNDSILEKLWENCLEIGITLHPPDWGRFAAAAGNAERPDLLEIIWKAWRESDVELNSKSWGSFAQAVANSKHKTLLKEIWEERKSIDRTITPTEWSRFANASTITKHPEILEELIQIINTPDLLDLEASFDILNRSYPNANICKIGGKFEDACRHLMKWIINSYFHCDETELNERLTSLIDRIFLIKGKHLKVIQLMLSRGQETYAGCIRFRLCTSFDREFAYLNEITDNQIVTEIISGNISERIKNFQENGVNQIFDLKCFPNIMNKPEIEKYESLIDYTISNHVDYLTDRKIFYNSEDIEEVRSAYFGNIERLFNEASPETMTKPQWADFFLVFMSRMANDVANAILDQLKGDIHTLKRKFIDKYETPIKASIDQNEKLEIAKEALRFLDEFSKRLPGYRIGEIISIDIINEIKKYLVKGKENHPGTIVDLPDKLIVAGYDGIMHDHLEPMLSEIRYNADKALKNLPDNEQIYRISVEKDDPLYKGYGVLTVSNSCEIVKDDMNPDPYSTGSGLKNIQYRSEFFKLGNNDGWAIPYYPDENSEVPMFTWKIYFPLLEQ